MTTKERPILYQGAMVRAILAGTKTQTRRVMARQKKHDFTDYTLFGQRGHADDEAERRGGWGEPWVAIEHAPDWPDGKDEQCLCPYARQRGDRLWVREAWQTDARYDAVRPALLPRDAPIAYWEGDAKFARGRVRPSIHMPRWASRITLEVTGLRIERLQQISEADAIQEGYPRDWKPGGPGVWSSPCQWYADLWKDIHGEDSWDKNPWVWVVEFRRVP